MRALGGGREFIARWRWAKKFRSFDPDKLGEIIAQFEARQRNLERSHEEMQRLLLVASAKMDEILTFPDAKTNLASILDIKNLGYEIGRFVAEKQLRRDDPVTIDHTPLASKLCTEADFSTDWLHYWCRELRTTPYYHRKIWELCFIAQALFARDQLRPGRRGLGFGCGEEPLPSLFAKYGARVTATDLDPDRPEAEVWLQTTQHASSIDKVRRADICPDQDRLADIEFRSADMNDIPRDFDSQFDFCWSACALEHLGTIDHGLRFIENSLRTLKPGGIAVHTTEFTLNEGPTIDNHPVVLYQRQHLDAFAARLRAAGHQVAEFDFNPGSGIMDRFVDLPPYFGNSLIGQQYAHLKMLFDGYTCTSIGIIITA
jgi:SAM-dependent methyltransferase